MKLYCIELIPVRKKPSEQDFLQICKGMPTEPGERADVARLLFTAKVMTGLSDQRTPHFATSRQRLMLFTDRKAAMARARKEANEFWTSHVREARIMPS